MNRFPICGYCNKQLKQFSCYCGNKCKIKDEVRFKTLDEWDKLHPNYNYIESKEREKILNECRKKK